MRRFTAKDVASVAVMTALLVAGQVALGAVRGVEIVTVLLLCYSYSFGVGKGMASATAFSLLRCFLWGFYPAVILLYLVYYNAFACLFGVIGAKHFRKIKNSGNDEKNESEKRESIREIIVTDLLFVLIILICVLMISGVIKISAVLSKGLKVLSWVIVCFATAGFSAYNVLFVLSKKYPRLATVRFVIAVTALAAVCTICFSLLDDVITPLFFGYTAEAAAAYFYASFTAMIPQTLCTVVTVSTLFCPLTKIFSMAAKSI